MTIPKRDPRNSKPKKSAPAEQCDTSQKHQADRSGRALFANVRDRLRAPVSAVIEYSAMLLEDAQEQGRDGIASDLAKIHALGKKLSSVVDADLERAFSSPEKTGGEQEAFTADFRHELCTPLNAIIGYSEMLIEDAAADGSEAFVPDLERIRKAGRQLLACIDNPAGCGQDCSRPVTPEAGDAVRVAMSDIPELDSANSASLAAGRGSLLVVDDNEISRGLMQRQLERQGHIVATAENGSRALDILKARTFDLVLLDIMMPDMSGYQVLKHLKSSDVYADIPVIVVSALDDMDSVVQCIRMGAEDYLIKPFNQVLLKARIRTCLDNKRLRDISEALELRNLKEDVQLIAESRAMQHVLGTMRAVSRNPVNVLIQGESGSGKEVIARMIHHHSDRKDKPFVAVNCASIPENLMESEFFGYERGAFTGAVTGRGGRFEEADGGTLFLDEIGDMPLAIQPKFLRVIQEGEGARLGSSKPLRYDLRIICASNKDLRQEVAEGRFREDLFYRIFSIEVPVPPLRERREDIVPLTLFFINKVSRRFKKKIKGFSPEVLSLFEEYPWPGNVRQLLHEVEHLAALTPEGELMSLKQCSPELRKWRTSSSLAPPQNRAAHSLHDRVEALEIALIKDALQKTGGNKLQTSKLLGITRQGLDKKLRRYKIGDWSKDG